MNHSLGKPGKVLFLLGTGGVGKTTASLVLAYALARRGRRVQLLTVDPARRLYDMASKVQASHPNLSVFHLDVPSLFDGFIRRNAPDEETARQILDSRFAPFLTDHLPALHEYVASDRILEDYRSEKFDHIVVDTPPFAYALHFLDAPERLRRMASRARGLLSGKGGVGRRALSPVLTRGLSFFLGRGFLGELVEFLASFDRLWVSLEDRSRGSMQLFQEDSTFGVVVVPEARSVDDLLSFLRGAPEWLKLDFVLANRSVLLPEMHEASPLDRDQVSRLLSKLDGCTGALERLSRGIVESARLASGMADHQARALSRVEREYPALARQLLRFPLLPGGVDGVAHLEGLAQVAEEWMEARWFQD